MNTKILILLVALVTMSIPTVHADISGSLPSPAIVTINYNINTNTNFLVQTVASDNIMNFTTNRDGKLVEPIGQNVSLNPNLPWANITNQGEVGQAFKVKLGAINTGTTIYASNVSSFSPQTTLSTTLAQVSGWATTPVGGMVNLYVRANFTNAPGGTGTLTISP